jgi:hypothetical protein
MEISDGAIADSVQDAAQQVAALVAIRRDELQMLTTEAADKRISFVFEHVNKLFTRVVRIFITLCCIKKSLNLLILLL